MRLRNAECGMRNTRGFTVLEVVIVVVILGIIGVIGGQILIEAYRSAYSSQDLSGVDWQARVATERMIRDLHHARSASATDLPTMTAATLAFVDVSGNTITYTLSGTTLTRQLNAGSALSLANNVSALAFSYRDINGTVTATAANVRFITADLTFTLNDVIRTYRFTVFPINYL